MKSKNLLPQTEGMIENPINSANAQHQPAKLHSRSKRKPVPPVWQVLVKARNVFDVQIDKSNETKLKCIDIFMTVGFSDSEKFWSDFMERVYELLDSRKFHRECREFGLNAECVAEHIVFLGSATMKRVMKNGIYKTIGNDVKLYGERFSPAGTDRYRSVYGYLPENDQSRVDMQRG